MGLLVQTFDNLLARIKLSCLLPDYDGKGRTSWTGRAASWLPLSAPTNPGQCLFGLGAPNIVNSRLYAAGASVSRVCCGTALAPWPERHPARLGGVRSVTGQGADWSAFPGSLLLPTKWLPPTVTLFSSWAGRPRILILMGPVVTAIRLPRQRTKLQFRCPNSSL